MVLSKTEKKARKARNRDRRASAGVEKQAVALRQAGIPQILWPSVVTPISGIDQQRIETTGTGRGGVAIFRRCPNPALKHYLARAHITAKQYEAALHLYLVFEDASIPPGVVMDPTRDFSPGGGWRDFMPARLDSHRRLEALFRSVDGKAGKLMVHDVCCLGKMLSEGSYGHFIDTRAKMARFREALDDLRAAYERMPQR